MIKLLQEIYRKKDSTIPEPKSLRGAFSLLELLIVSSIFSVMMLSIYSAFQAGILSYNKMDSAFNIYQTARVILNRMEQELKNSFIYCLEDSGFEGQGQALRFFSLSDAFAQGRAVANICRIKYEQDLTNNVLKRNVSRGLAVLESDDKGASAEELSSAIQKISFEYASSSNRLDEPFTWQPAWPKPGDAEQKKELPLAVRIKLSLAEKNKKQQEISAIEFTKIVALALGR